MCTGNSYHLSTLGDFIFLTIFVISFPKINQTIKLNIFAFIFHLYFLEELPLHMPLPISFWLIVYFLLISQSPSNILEISPLLYMHM